MGHEPVEDEGDDPVGPREAIGLDGAEENVNGDADVREQQRTVK